MQFLDATDLEPFAEISATKASAMIADAEALAVTVAPCFGDPDIELTDSQVAAVKAILRGAVLRWNDSGSGALKSESITNYTVTYDDRHQRRSLFWPSEIEQLQAICATVSGASDGGAFTIDTVGGSTLVHAETCSAVFGANYCDCGAVLTGGYPLFGL